MAKKILITGGTGLIGSHLTSHLIKKGYDVCHLSRNKSADTKVETFFWNIENKQIDEKCIDGVDTIVHLAGAGIADKRWTSKRKQILIKSRTDSIALLYNLLSKKEHKVKSVISASAAGYYSNRGDKLLNENDSPNTDFLAECCVLWEKAVDAGKNLNLRIVKLRTGLVLDKDKGALPKLALPVKLGFGAPLGSGKQWISWIHIADAINVYTHTIENENMSGAYNMGTPNPLTNKEFNKALAAYFRKPLWLSNVPKFVLKIALGEMRSTVLGSTRMDTEKIQSTGFWFRYPDMISALENIYKE